MATETVTPNSEREAAASAIFGAIAQDMHNLSELLFDASIGDGEVTPAMLVAATTLASRAGSLADRAAQACGTGGGIRDADEWLLPEHTLHALQSLCAAREAT